MLRIWTAQCNYENPYLGGRRGKREGNEVTGEKLMLCVSKKIVALARTVIHTAGRALQSDS